MLKLKLLFYSLPIVLSALFVFSISSCSKSEPIILNAGESFTISNIKHANEYKKIAKAKCCFYANQSYAYVDQWKTNEDSINDSSISDGTLLPDNGQAIIYWECVNYFASSWKKGDAVEYHSPFSSQWEKDATDATKFNISFSYKKDSQDTFTSTTFSYKINDAKNSINFENISASSILVKSLFWDSVSINIE